MVLAFSVLQLQRSCPAAPFNRFCAAQTPCSSGLYVLCTCFRDACS